MGTWKWPSGNSGCDSRHRGASGEARRGPRRGRAWWALQRKAARCHLPPGLGTLCLLPGVTQRNNTSSDQHRDSGGQCHPGRHRPQGKGGEAGSSRDGTPGAAFSNDSATRRRWASSPTGPTGPQGGLQQGRERGGEAGPVPPAPTVAASSVTGHFSGNGQSTGKLTGRKEAKKQPLLGPRRGRSPPRASASLRL